MRGSPFKGSLHRDPTSTSQCIYVALQQARGVLYPISRQAYAPCLLQLRPLLMYLQQAPEYDAVCLRFYIANKPI